MDIKTGYSKMLTEPDIIECRNIHEGIIIAPFNKNKAKGIGYNISPSDLLYSTQKCAPLKIRHNDEGSYVYIAAHDTVLILSYEHIQSAKDITGTFHSRVRSSADGLGSVSTTLDPGWKGMLLISVNNPTKRKIKLHITTKKEGKTERCNLITMVVFKNYSVNKEENEVSFHLDNPPMRADIWSELIAKPHRLFHEKSYKRFRHFIQELIDFTPKETEKIKKCKKILEMIVEIEISLFSKKSFELLQESLIRLEHELCDDGQLIVKYETLKNIINDKKTDIFDQKEEMNLKKQIKLFKEECKYLMLCEEVTQIHKYISGNIEYWWTKSLFYKIFYNYILPNIPAILASILLIWILFFGLTYDFGKDSNVIKIIIAALPSILSFLLNWINKKKNKN
jgi:deoxycytidine triphosphate deaminase